MEPELILPICLALTVFVNEGSSTTNVTDTTIPPNQQLAVSNELDRGTPGFSYPEPSYATFFQTPPRTFYPPAGLRNRGTLFGEGMMGPFWGHSHGFGMPPTLRMGLEYLLSGIANGYARGYGPYTSPMNQFNARVPVPASPYYNYPPAQPFQPQTVGVPPYYPAQPGMPYNQLSSPNSPPQSSYYTGQPQLRPAPHSAIDRNGRQGIETQLEAPPTRTNPYNQRPESQSFQNAVPPNARTQTSAASNQPQYNAAG